MTPRETALPTRPPCILVVEDDSHLAASLRQGLQERGFEVACVKSLQDARATLGRGSFDLVVLDLGLADADGLTLLEELRAGDNPIPILITTARGGIEQRVRGLELGADDYLVKPYAFAELLARIHVQLRHQHQPPPRQRLADLVIDARTRTATRGGRLIDLTPREFDLLAYLLDANGGVVTRDMLARDVWRLHSWTRSMNNVIDVHISRLRDKIDKSHPARLLHTLRGVGFVLKENP